VVYLPGDGWATDGLTTAGLPVGYQAFFAARARGQERRPH